MKKALIISGAGILLIAAAVTYLFASGTIASWIGNTTTQSIEIESTLPSETIDDTPEERKAVHDPKILASLERIGYKDREINNLDLIVASNAEVQEVCGWEEAGGCFYGEFISDDSFDMHYLLYIVDDLTNDEFDLFVAHEYLHYVWTIDELERDRKLVDALYGLYHSDPWIQERIVAHYTEDKNDISTEIFSYGCTELTEEMLGEYLSSECNRYINTSLLPAL